MRILDGEAQMKYNVYLTAFRKNGHQIREVKVPDGECNGDTDFVLNRIFWWGQNEAQPKNMRSVSVGDAIEYNQKYYLILFAGFSEISKKQMDEFKKLEHIKKMKYLMGMENE